jgi:hypothetical protein
MLNEIVRRLNGHGEDPESLEEALKLLADQKAAARAALTECHERRRQALLDDASDAALDKLEREIERGETRIEKLTIAEPSLRERLRVARAAADKREGDETVTAYLAHSEDVARKVEAADAAAAVQRLFWDRHQGVLARLGIEPLGCMLILGNGFGIQWAQHTRQVIAAVRAARARRDNPQLAPQPPAIAAASENPVSAQSISVRARLPYERPPLTDAHGPRPADDLTPLQPGEARVRYVGRGGWSPFADQPQWHHDQIGIVPLDLAERVAANAGIIEILQRYGESNSAITIVGKPDPAVDTRR